MLRVHDVTHLPRTVNPRCWGVLHSAMWHYNELIDDRNRQNIF